MFFFCKKNWDVTSFFADDVIFVYDVIKIQQKLKIRQLLNRLSSENGWPLVGKLLQGDIF